MYIYACVARTFITFLGRECMKSYFVAALCMLAAMVVMFIATFVVDLMWETSLDVAMQLVLAGTATLLLCAAVVAVALLKQAKKALARPAQSVEWQVANLSIHMLQVFRIVIEEDAHYPSTQEFRQMLDFLRDFDDSDGVVLLRSLAQDAVHRGTIYSPRDQREKDERIEAIRAVLRQFRSRLMGKEKVAASTRRGA